MYSQASTKQQKNKQALKAGFSSEFDNKTDRQPPLGGILSLGQTIEIQSQTKSAEKQNHLVFESLYGLQKQEHLLLDSRQKELKDAISKLRSEIKALIKASQNLDRQTQKAVIEAENIPEPSQYQITFLQRIQRLVSLFRQNVSEASAWVEALTSKKKKRNTFWKRVKSDGQKYLFSGEHGASRSAA